MKKYCKDVDITNRELISHAVYNCIDNKYTRSDTLQLLTKYSDLTTKDIKNGIKQNGKQFAYPIVEEIINGIQQELLNKDIKLKPISYKEKIDPSNFKLRRIGIQDVKQQLYDYIAVEGLRPFFVYIGEHQYATIKGRGQIIGVQTIKRRLRNKNIRYVGKADIKKCYESIDKNRLMAFLQRHIKNDLLLWLVNELLNTFESGLSIGSYLSQYLCNLYLAQLYHEISENMCRIRRHKDGTTERINLVKHVVFYADDILILGTNAKDIHKAMRLIVKCVDEKLGLKIKPSWVVFKAKTGDKSNDGQFVDMMGFRVYRQHITIRRRVFKRIRRCYMRVWKMIKTHRKIPLLYARRCISYYGQIKNSNSYKIKIKYHIYQVLNICKKVVAVYDSKIYKAATGS
jgi:hypothetical protein